ncbi:MAG: UBP-type zinc finger domain-containing protein [Gammaproteobacteria bacterium]
MYEKSCEHLTEGEAPEAQSEGCKACLKIGQEPVELRICRTCGQVGCCDSTPGQHATAHFHQTGHATMQSFEPGDDWGWCYEHKMGIGPFPPAR